MYKEYIKRGKTRTYMNIVHDYYGCVYTVYISDNARVLFTLSEDSWRRDRGQVALKMILQYI